MAQKTRANFVIAGTIIAFIGLFPAWFTASGPGGSISLNVFGIASNGGLEGLVYWLLPVAIIILFLTAVASHNAIGSKVTRWQRYLLGLCVLDIIVGFIRGVNDANSTFNSDVSWSIGIGFFITVLGFIIAGVGIVTRPTFTPQKK
jgi:hypothetical protein